MSAKGEFMSNNVVVRRSWPWGVFFVMTDIGAAIYFISHSNGTFWGVVLGLLQAAIWPVYVIFHLLAILHV
jgi:hypothetical protein